MKKYILILIALFALNINLFAVPANPNIIEVSQPDGTKIKIKVQGDEFYNWHEDEDGYTIVQDKKSKIWSYAKEDVLGKLVSSTDFVGKTKPEFKGIKKHLKDKNKFNEAKLRKQKQNSELNNILRKKEASRIQKTSQNLTSQKSSSSILKVPGTPETKTNFVLLIQFRDLKFKDNPPFNSSTTDEEVIQTFSDLFNKENYKVDGSYGSVKDYFKEVSYGQLNYVTVVSPKIITIDQDYEYYADRNPESTERVFEMIKDALDELDSSGYNFKSVWPTSTTPEGFTVIHAGGGAENGNNSFIWSHYNLNPLNVWHDGIKFENYHIEPAGRGYDGNMGLVRIGVVCHESLHFFGVPDLYDASNNGTKGLGKFCLMAEGNWNGDNGSCPSHPCAWIKNELGWISLQTASDGVNYINSSAQYYDGFYKFTSTGLDSKEYFLMENRQGYGFDSFLPGSTRGILIYHVDENMENNNDYRHYMVDIEEADGTSDWTQDHLARSVNSGKDSDYFRNSTVSYFYDDSVSSPNSRSYYSNNPSDIKISCISKSESVMSFVYGKDIVIVDGISNVVAYPNPARKGYMYFTNLSSDVSDFSLELYTILGQFVKGFTKEDIDTSTGINRIKWTCQNMTGQNVAPGVYLALIKSNSSKKKLKVAVIR